MNLESFLMGKTIIFSALILYLLLSPFGFLSAAETSSLELTYPNIPGMEEITPETISTGLPEYVNYIFRLAVFLIGLVIFGVVVYNGINYLTSVGEPAKLGAAKSGILSGFLGAIILLSAYFIFNTINPQLLKLEITKLDPLRPMISPGIYVCSYEVDSSDIQDCIDDYISNDREKQTEAAKKLKEIMAPGGNDSCVKMTFSGKFENFAVKEDDNTFFSIPGARTQDGELVYDVYEYGLILHEKDNFGGEGKLVTDPPYNAIDYLPDFDFTARSFTLFKKVTTAVSGEAKGAVLYSCPNYNEGGLCPEGVATTSIDSIRPGGDAEIRKINNLGDLDENVRSIQIDPKGSFFAVLFSGDNFNGDKCEVIAANDNNLLDNPIGRCGSCFVSIWSYVNPRNWVGDCYPCPKSIIVIKGQVL